MWTDGHAEGKSACPDKEQKAGPSFPNSNAKKNQTKGNPLQL
jgi:hypothetical protein